jgi:hypothetical protein
VQREEIISQRIMTSVHRIAVAAGYKHCPKANDTQDENCVDVTHIHFEKLAELIKIAERKGHFMEPARPKAPTAPKMPAARAFAPAARRLLAQVDEPVPAINALQTGGKDKWHIHHRCAASSLLAVWFLACRIESTWFRVVLFCAGTTTTTGAARFSPVTTPSSAVSLLVLCCAVGLRLLSCDSCFECDSCRHHNHHSHHWHHNHHRWHVSASAIRRSPGLIAEAIPPVGFSHGLCVSLMPLRPPLSLRRWVGVRALVRG